MTQGARSMKDDELLKGLTAAARDEAHASASDATWTALAHGTLDDAALADLEARAADDPEVAQGLSTFAPFDKAFEETIALSFVASPKSERETRAKVAPFVSRPPRPSLLKRASTIGAPLALAAGVALFVGLRGQGGAALPAYELVMTANAQELRAGEPHAVTGEARLHPHAYFEAFARPTTPAGGALEARAALVRDGHAQLWSAPLSISKDGVVTLAGACESLFPSTTGAYEVVVAVARRGELPSDAAFATCAEVGGRCAGRVARIRVVFVGE